MTRIPLEQGWLLASQRETLGARPQEPSYQPVDWLPVTVPTTVQAALVAAGRAPDPWRDRQVEALRAVEGETWYYRTEFTVPEDEAGAAVFELVFAGVSLFATVWLNGHPVAFLRNAYHEHRIEVTRHINRTGPNCLVVECGLRLEEARKRVRGDVSDLNARGGEAARPYLRIPQMVFGWDFAPRLAVIGLWRGVSLLCHHGASIDDLHVVTRALEGGTAELAIQAQVRAFAGADGPLTLHLSIHEDPAGPPVWEGTLPMSVAGTAEAEVALPRVRPWYPHPYGEPFRYTLRARLQEAGREVDRMETRFGVRTVTLKQDGRFTFCVNGIDVFARGANWVPPHSLTLDASEEQYQHLLGLAHEAHFNMLRVWGGGTYEADRFYDLCDEHGIMVWQDFMYACAMYPDDDPEFMESARQEARAAVMRLRRHPSLALWCGNNECQEAWMLGDWAERAPRHLGERLYDHVLPGVVTELSPEVPYWPGSPFGGPTTRSRSVGDFHDWYSLPDWRKYDENAPLFSSEYGFRSVPHRETVAAMISADLQWDEHGPQHVVWKFHHGWCGWLQQVLPEFGHARTLEEYIALSQEAQATLMRYAVEVYRRRMPGTSGSLIWQYNEPWPAVTFSLVDFFGRPKAAYHWVRRAHAPVICLFYAGAEGLTLWAVNDLQQELPCTGRIRRFSYAGKPLAEHTLEGRLAANGATMLLGPLPAELLPAQPQHEFLRAELRVSDHAAECTHHPALRREWVLPEAQVAARVERGGGDVVRVSLESEGYVHFLSLSVPEPQARYSDNFLDLLPGEPRVVEIRGTAAREITVRAANAGARMVPVR